MISKRTLLKGGVLRSSKDLRIYQIAYMKIVPNLTLIDFQAIPLPHPQ